MPSRLGVLAREKYLLISPWRAWASYFAVGTTTGTMPGKLAALAILTGHYKLVCFSGMKTHLPFIFILFNLSGCAAYQNSQYSEYHGPAIIEGVGGTKRTVDGFDIWTSGDPPQKYRILGVIDQNVYDNNSVMSKLAVMNSESDLIKTAKSKGADAIILVGSNTKTTGFNVNNAAYNYSGGVSPVSVDANTSNSKRVIAIKYIP